MAKGNRGYSKFRKKNPVTGKDYEYGDPHPDNDGRIFKSYRVDKPIVKKTGFYQMSWVYPKKRRFDGIDRLNPKTNKPFLLGDVEIQNGKKMYFKKYERNEVYKVGHRKGCFYETWWNQKEWDKKKSDVKKKQEMINEGFVPTKAINPQTKKEYKHGDWRINPKTKEKEWFIRYLSGFSLKDGIRYVAWASYDKYLRDRINGINKGCKKRALKKGLDYNLDIDYLESIFPKDNICPVLGIKMEFHVGSVQTSPSVDRIDSKKGYVKGNVAWVSYRANSIKQDATIEELEKVFKFYKKKGTSI
tara:strand:- start:110 stop:1015 length:906 start_codon:yes stop_codon:yes gene_type:complete